MALAHSLGFPRIGRDRELKKAVEAFWRGELDESALLENGRRLRAEHWRLQHAAGIELLPVGDFAWYDQMLNHALLLDVVPQRFRHEGEATGLHTLFTMARGAGSSCCGGTAALEMTKWFDTNYHYLVPEFSADQQFALGWTQLFDEVQEAQALGYRVKPVLIGPLTFLWLGKCRDGSDRLNLLERLLPVYAELLDRLQQQGVGWVQIDEPILGLDLPVEWKQAFERAYHQLQPAGPQKLLALYFSGLQDNLGLAASLPVAGLHVDLVRAPEQFPAILDRLPPYKVLSLGLVNGRNVWRCDLDAALEVLQQAHERLGERLWVAPSCSLLHCPLDLADETQLDDELRSWLAFAVQKCEEVALLARAVDNPSDPQLQAALAAQRAVQQSRRDSARSCNPLVRQRLVAIEQGEPARRTPVSERLRIQQQHLQLPLLPTTSIGSFPQTAEIRQARRDWRSGVLDDAAYRQAMRAEIGRVIAEQEALGLDVLVHGEAERNDMVEYFAQQLDGYAFTANGWVQSYGTRCVKPAIIVGDIHRPQAMTLEWIAHARSLTDRPVKGMLTGPVTMLQWSFPREDLSRAEQFGQLALAIRDEVLDLERAGTPIIQIDEAAFREGLPLRRADQRQYLDEAVYAFRLCSAAVQDHTQIHTHMCYSEFSTVIDWIAALDADVISIETARSQMALLDAFASAGWRSGIGPGLYDIHSSRVPAEEEMLALLHRASHCIDPALLWVNPDCGLKTRGWAETRAALAAMVSAAHRLRPVLGADRDPVAAEA